MLPLRSLRAHPWRAIRLTRAVSTETHAPQTPTQRHGFLPGAPGSAITTKLDFFNSVLESSQIPTYRVLDGTGNFIDGAELPEVCS